ncbi:LysR family transcriptional regulator [Ralstonia wenshanensis]|uniref:LysR family transcriptional regulator n=1 Tax=Ralstonia wenshanensis TaxID=2842456 RepID=UPI002AACBA62|nr:LysR family transcriptional regulator [Ralstonia wenshanensis]MDY7510319.1 LysR family transcriptional regulator [Ralstonia wenshanensis]
MDRLSSMAVFVRAVDAGSFSSAGLALDMSPQLVGKQVRLLEQHLGVRLLNRTTRRQSLTDFGQRFYERAKIILAEVEIAESMAAEMRIVPSGLLRINAPVSFGTHALAPRLPEYLARYPDVSVELTMSNREVDLIEEGYDIVFRVGELRDSGLIGRALAPYRLVLCAAPSYLEVSAPLRSPSDLAQHQCLLFLRGAYRDTWTFDGPNGREVVPVSGHLSADNGESLLQAGLAGAGILLQPSELVATAIEQGRLIRLLEHYHPPARSFHLLHGRDGQMTPKLRSFLDFALQVFKER